jgi:2-dehydropantoate 2-reductase
MTFIISGIGAIGGTIAGHLANSGQPVAGIARGKQLDALREDGLLLRTPAGDIRTRFTVAADPTELTIGSNDVIVLAMKGQDTADALVRLRAAGVTTQPIVCAQNGVDNERAALRLFPNVYGMTVIIPADFIKPGEVASFGTPIFGLFDIGRYPSGRDAAAEEIVTALNGAGFAAFVHDDVMQSKYGKLLSNLGNVLDAAAGGDAGENGAILDAARAEAEAVYRAAGITIDSRGTLGDKRRDNVRVGDIAGIDRMGSSTAQSLARGTGTIETDYFNGEIALLGRLHGVPVPINAALAALGHKLVTERIAPGSLSLAGVQAFIDAHR